MKTQLLLLFLFINFANAQISELTLPNGFGAEFSFSNTNTTPILNVYISKKGNLRLESLKLPIEHLGETLFKQKGTLALELVPFLFIHLYVDKNVLYETVEKVKAQLSSASTFRVVYRTDDINDLSKGISAKLQQSLIPEIKNSSKPDESSIEVDVLMADIPMVAVHPIDQMIKEFYSLNFNQAKEILTNYNYDKIEIFNETTVKINNEKIDLNDDEKVYSALKESDFVFISMSKKIKYKTYIKNISFLKKIYRKNKKPIAFIEISSGLQKKLEEQKIKL